MNRSTDWEERPKPGLAGSPQLVSGERGVAHGLPAAARPDLPQLHRVTCPNPLASILPGCTRAWLGQQQCRCKKTTGKRSHHSTMHPSAVTGMEATAACEDDGVHAPSGVP